MFKLSGLKNKFAISDQHIVLLEKYSLLMQKWNQSIQMTATKDLSEFISRHIVDSLELAKFIPDHKARMLDVGSGGGLPGIILAIVRPNVSFTLIEPTQKKHAFLSTVRRELSLKNLKTFPIRDSQLKEKPDFQTYDYAVARAVWAVEVWLERGKSLVSPQGTLFAMEGSTQTKLPPHVLRHPYSLDGGRNRSILSMLVED